MKKWLKRQERRCVRAIALLLVLSILAWGQGTAVLADTVSTNSADAEALDAEKAAEPEMALEAQTQAATPANPIHHCVQKDDSTDFSYVYFGSYPQSEVTDKETIDAIEKAIAAAGTDEIEAEGADAVKTVGVDVELELDGSTKSKYRRIGKNYDDCISTKYFGDVDYRYFEWEPIKWRVLKIDNGTLFVMADSVLDCKRYNDSFGTITWENCTIRSWLNGSFFEGAFSSGEQKAIMQWHVETEDNSYYTNGGKGGGDTEDYVYLLSIEDMTNDRYGFCSDVSANSISRRLQPSDYAHARGVWRTDSGGVAQRDDDGPWWLRSPGGAGTYAANVAYDGFVNRNGQYASYSNCGVLPVLHIDLSLWSVADDGTGEGGAATTERNLANPVHHCKLKPDYTDFSYVYFGSYPQSEVTDSETIAAIDSAIAAGNTVVGDLGVDVWIGNMKYRRIIKDDTGEDDTGEDDTGDDGYRYFMWRRIKWRVLNANDDGTLFVMADSALDCKEYHVEKRAITWEDSTIRRWLNGSFYEIAFSSREQEAIKQWKVVNEDKPKYGEVVGRDTTDQIYLLSIGEVTNEGYGFCSDSSADSESRWLQPSDYAHARGVPRSIYEGSEDNCAYWLRSPGEFSNVAARVYSFGSVNSAGTSVANQNNGVAPVLHINLSSDRWLQEDDGTSGEGGGRPTESEGDGSGTGEGGSGTVKEPGKEPGKEPDKESGSGADTAAVRVTSISIKAPSKKLAAGKKVKLSVKVKPSNATNRSVKWEISNKKYASIDQKGKLKLKRAGAGKTVKVTARAADGSGVKVSYKIKIMKHAVKKVKITAPKKTVKAGKKIKLKAVVTTTGKNANKALKWSSSNRKYATVNSKGLVKTKKAGKGKTVTITARATDGSNKSAKVKIKIK